MELIDTHQHLMYRDQVGYSWANEFPPIDKGNFTLENYKELTKGFDIKGTLFMETGVDDSDYKKEAKFIKSIMDQPNSNMKGLILSSFILQLVNLAFLGIRDSLPVDKLSTM